MEKCQEDIVIRRGIVRPDINGGIPIQNLANQALNGTQEAEKRLVNHLKNRQAIETQQIARARELVLPLERPQERVLTLAPWLARYGPTLLTDLAAAIHDWVQPCGPGVASGSART